MRKIPVTKWKAKGPDGKETEEDILLLLNMLISNKHPEDMPKGLDKFRLFSRLSKAFEEATKTGTLVLEDLEYKFLSDTIEKDIPSIWGGNKNIRAAVEAFMTAPREET